MINCARTRLWQVLHTVQPEWGLIWDLSRTLFHSAVILGLFFGALVCASVLRYSTCLAELNGILALAPWMAYRLERFTSIEASLGFEGLMPVRQQIFQSLTGYMLWKRKATLVADDHELAAHGAMWLPVS